MAIAPVIRRRIRLADDPVRKPKASPTPAGVPCAVLIDGSALYFASAARGAEGRRLNYPALAELLRKEVPGLLEPLSAEFASKSDPIWTMWTSAAPGNAGQTKFLEFAEQRLCWQVRSSFPSHSFMVEPDTLFGIGADAAKASRLLRFDAQIAFAMGRLAETHRLIIISDSYALKDAMERVNEAWSERHGKSVFAFFGQSCDSRWRGALGGQWSPDFIDLDDHYQELFGLDPEKESSRPATQPGHLVF